MAKPSNGTSTATVASGAEVQEDYYELLGVTRDATESEIKAKFRKLALQYHPDRNPGDLKAQEHFKKLSIAYAVISDPVKRRQYDVSGPSSSLEAFEACDISEIGTLGRAFGALFNKLGVPIPTQIAPKVLNQARCIVTGQPTPDDIKSVELQPGKAISATVGKQEATFYSIDVTAEHNRRGVLVRVRSTAMSKFKLVLFDREGNVRFFQESQKRSKLYTHTEMYFTPFTVANLGEYTPVKYMTQGVQAPVEFFRLEALEQQTAQLLDPARHYFAVYGDNWMNSVKYEIVFFPLPETSAAPFEAIRTCEKTLLDKKTEMARFQVEYMAAKKKYEECVLRLKSETDTIEALVKDRQTHYDQVMAHCEAAHASHDVTPTRQGRGFLGLF